MVMLFIIYRNIIISYREFMLQNVADFCGIYHMYIPILFYLCVKLLISWLK